MITARPRRAKNPAPTTEPMPINAEPRTLTWAPESPAIGIRACLPVAADGRTTRDGAGHPIRAAAFVVVAGMRAVSFGSYATTLFVGDNAWSGWDNRFA
jgi:hypothetical protein